MGKRWALPSVLIVGGCWLELDGAPLTELVYGQVVEVGVEQRILRASSNTARNNVQKAQWIFF
jgi:hypothetical protein